MDKLTMVQHVGKRCNQEAHLRPCPTQTVVTPILRAPSTCSCT